MFHLRKQAKAKDAVLKIDLFFKQKSDGRYNPAPVEAPKRMVIEYVPEYINCAVMG